MIVPAHDRKGDEVLLTWLRLRSGGKNCGQIGRMFGAPSQSVNNATNNVLLADLKHSTSEKSAVIRSAYWQRGQ